ncbi:MAG: hypothetical protein RIR00_1735, partial [Pseudomonadota bacterium]
ILDHVSFPGSALVFCVEGNNARIGRRMRWRQRGSRLI